MFDPRLADKEWRKEPDYDAIADKIGRTIGKGVEKGVDGMGYAKRTMGNAAKWTGRQFKYSMETGNAFVFLAVALVIADYWMYGSMFAGFDIFLYPSYSFVWGAGSITHFFINAFTAFTIPALLVFIIKRSIERNFSTEEIFSLGLFVTIVGGILLSMYWAVDFRAMLHFGLAIFFGIFFIWPGGGISAMSYWTSMLILVDFFGYDMVKHWPMFTYIPFLSVMIIFIVWGKTQSRWARFFSIFIIMMTAILTFGAMGAHGSFTPLQNTPKISESWGELKAGIFNIRDSMKQSYDRQLEYATGGYYNGVQEKAEEPLGVYLESLEAGQKSFYSNEPTVLWGGLRAKSIDADEGVEIELSCYDKADERSAGTIEPERLFTLMDYDIRDFSCFFDSDELAEGPHNIVISAEFSFRTDSYLKTYFIDAGKNRELRRADIDPLAEYKIAEKDPVAIYTNGPVRIGAEVGSTLPLPVSSSDSAAFHLGITIENQWEGVIEQVNSISITPPEGVSAVRCYVENVLGSAGSDRTIRFDVSTIRQYHDIRNFRSFTCIFKPDDIGKVLGGSPISTEYFRVSVEYDYKLMEEVSIEIKDVPQELINENIDDTEAED